MKSVQIPGPNVKDHFSIVYFSYGSLKVNSSINRRGASPEEEQYIGVLQHAP